MAGERLTSSLCNRQNEIDWPGFYCYRILLDSFLVVTMVSSETVIQILGSIASII